EKSQSHLTALVNSDGRTRNSHGLSPLYPLPPLPPRKGLNKRGPEAPVRVARDGKPCSANTCALRRYLLAKTLFWCWHAFFLAWHFPRGRRIRDLPSSGRGPGFRGEPHTRRRDDRAARCPLPAGPTPLPGRVDGPPAPR